jgi:hypothetical protein
VVVLSGKNRGKIDLMRLAIQCGIVAGVTAVFTRLLPSHRDGAKARDSQS